MPSRFANSTPVISCTFERPSRSPIEWVGQGGQYRHVLGVRRGLHASSYPSWCCATSVCWVGATARQRIIVFDVNETLLDVGALAPQFQRVFGNAGVAQEWFSNV